MLASLAGAAAARGSFWKSASSNRAILAEKKPAVAIRHFENSLNGIWTVPLRLEIHLTLARLYEGRGDLQAALTHYYGALENDEANAEAEAGIDRVKAAMAGRSE